MDPTKIPVEITNRQALTVNKFNCVRRLQFIRGGVGLRGRLRAGRQHDRLGPLCNLGIGGQYHIVRGNKILWGGDSGVGGTPTDWSSRTTSWPITAGKFEPGWHGGAVKLIPANADHLTAEQRSLLQLHLRHLVRHNNQGNRIEWNHCHDNSTIGLFDEFARQHLSE